MPAILHPSNSNDRYLPESPIHKNNMSFHKSHSIAAVTAVLTVVAAVIFMAAERIPYMPGMQCDRPLCHLLWAFRGYRILFPFNLCILYTYWSMFLHNLWISITYFYVFYICIRNVTYYNVFRDKEGRYKRCQWHPQSKDYMWVYHSPGIQDSKKIYLYEYDESMTTWKLPAAGFTANKWCSRGGTEETELKMPSDFRWHSFLVSAGYLPNTVLLIIKIC